MNDSAKIDIEGLTKKLIELSKRLCWNDLSNSCTNILSEITNTEKNFNENRIGRKRTNAKNKPLGLKQVSKELEKLYSNLYDVNLYVYRATKAKTIIEIQYFLKSSLEKDYFEKIKDNSPMFHCKVSTPIYLKTKDKKFDVNWELGGLRFKWNMFWYKRRVKSINN